MWGEYHLVELAVLVQRLGRGGRLTWLAPPTAAPYLNEVYRRLDYVEGYQ